MSDLADLKRRVEEATGPDRELDVELWVIDPKDSEPESAIPPYTASLDATVALIERVMPGFARHVAYIPNIPTRKTDAEARLWLPAQQTRGWKKETFSGDGKTEPLALLAALLSACEGGAK